MLGDSDFSNLTRLYLQHTGAYDLARIGLVCITANTTLGIYANYRQLKHISSRAWRPPVKIRTLLLNEKVDPDLIELSNDLGVRKIRRRLHMQIGAAVTGWLQSSVFLLGGYDALLRFTHTAAATLPHWLNHGPGTLSETLISTAVYCFSFPIIGLLVSYPAATIYKKVVPLPDDKTSFKGDVTENLRFEGIQLAKWRVWGIGLAGYVLSVGIPALATTAVYETLGAQKSTAFLKGMLWVGGGILLLLDGGIASFLLYCLYNKDKRPAVPIDKSHLFSTVTEWRAKNDVPYDIEAFEKRLQAILLKSATGCRLPLTVQVVEKEPADRPVKVLGQIQEDDNEPALNRLLSPYLRIMSDRQFLRLHGRQLRELGHEQNLALAASVLVDDQALTLGHIFRTIVVPQVNMIIMLIPFPLMHMFYVARPDSIRSIFPSLSPLSHHIPLVCSWSTTSSILPHMTWILDVWSSYVNTRQTLNVDKRVAALGPEFVRGWVSLLEARETTEKSKEENGDLGTRDKLYGWLYGNSLQPTRRLLEMQKYL